jgi:hypothetical protein
VIAVPLQAVERTGPDLAVVLQHALDAEEADPAAEFVAFLREVLANGGELGQDDLEWMLAESGLESMPELPEDLASRLSVDG